MIVSVSRRSDIPCHHFTWFLKKLEEGYVEVANPFNAKQIKRINLNKLDVDCFVFWTKNPRGLLANIDLIADYNYYIQYTITSYDTDIEPNIDKLEAIENFLKLAKIVGKHRIILRYDPIFLSNKYTIDYHIRAFNRLLTILKEATNKVIISFIDHYRNTPKWMRIPNIDEMKMLAQEMSKIANQYNISINTCAEEIDLSEYGIKPASCIDIELIEQIIGHPILIDKDKNQRKNCNCCQSIDIGTYNTCNSGCQYCYANFKKRE